MHLLRARRPGLLLIALAAAVGVLLFGLLAAALSWRLLSDGRQLLSSRETATPVRQEELDARLQASASARTAAASPLGASANEASAPTLHPRVAVESLRAAAEASLSGALHVGAILDAVLVLGDLRVDARDPDPRSRAAKEYLLLDLPPGIEQAKLQIGAPAEQGGKRSLSLRLKLQKPVEPYVVGGLARNGPVVDVGIVTDAKGKVLSGRLMTIMGLPPTNPELGFFNQRGQVAEGVAYRFDRADPSSGKAMTHGKDNGKPAQWDARIALIGDDPAEKWNDLAVLLSRMQAEVRK